MFRFTIRDVLWLTVVVALAVGWLQDRQRQSRSFESVNQARIELAALVVEREGLLDKYVQGWREAEARRR